MEFSLLCRLISIHVFYKQRESFGALTGVCTGGPDTENRESSPTLLHAKIYIHTYIRKVNIKSYPHFFSLGSRTILSLATPPPLSLSPCALCLIL